VTSEPSQCIAPGATKNLLVLTYALVGRRDSPWHRGGKCEDAGRVSWQSEGAHGGQFQDAGLGRGQGALHQGKVKCYVVSQPWWVGDIDMGFLSSTSRSDIFW
jgi:hypothetical protein